MTEEHPVSSPDQMADAWAKVRGLRRDETYYGRTTAQGLLAKSGEPWQHESNVEAELLDHSRYFKAAGKKLPGIAVSAPYVANLINKFGSLGNAQQEIFKLADSIGLRVRVGLPHDLIWPTSANTLMGMYPIVWWNPERADLQEIEQAVSGSERENHTIGTAWNKPMFYLPEHPLTGETSSAENWARWNRRYQY